MKAVAFLADAGAILAGIFMTFARTLREASHGAGDVKFVERRREERRGSPPPIPYRGIERRKGDRRKP